MTDLSTLRIARTTGIAYLGIIVTGMFAEFFVRMRLVVAGDAGATTANIAGSVGLFRAALAADLAMIALDVGVAVGLYVLLRPVHGPLALLAAVCRLMQAAVLGANTMNMAAALGWATRGAGTALGTDGAAAMVLASLELHRFVYDLALVFFGVACVLLGHLLRTSRLVPRPLGIGLVVAGAVYLVGSGIVVFAPALAPSFDPMYGLALISELAIAGWLTVKGVSRSGHASARSPRFA
ncbi:MAG: DUF4386 domain-containing protein [Myxococcales bacterium]|nr:DUF4386 domain-containing protein [Myxococcales bacterium]